MNDCYLLTGGNMGDTAGFLYQAERCIETDCGKIVKRSSVYETAAWGVEDQPPFLNQVLLIETLLSAPRLLQAILRIENNLGRRRETKYGPRIIDIDILFFHNDIIHTEGLTVPHPRLHERRFVLVPLAEIAPDFVHPVFQKTVAQLLAECMDALDVKRI